MVGQCYCRRCEGCKKKEGYELAKQKLSLAIAPYHYRVNSVYKLVIEGI